MHISAYMSNERQLLRNQLVFSFHHCVPQPLAFQESNQNQIDPWGLPQDSLSGLGCGCWSQVCVEVQTPSHPCWWCRWLPAPGLSLPRLWNGENAGPTGLLSTGDTARPPVARHRVCCVLVLFLELHYFQWWGRWFWGAGGGYWAIINIQEKSPFL